MSKSFLILFFLVPSIFSQTLPEKFFNALIYVKSEISDYINIDELKQSSRLGIEYTGVKNKVLIGYELPVEIKSGITSGKYKYEIKEQPLADPYTEVTFNVPAANYSRKYYFNNGFATSSTYYPWLWEKKESKYFTFRIEEPKYFNDYCIKRLDEFVDMIADTLGFTISERRILEREKIGYVFCKDEASVEKITGFKAKGMAMLGSDVVVTSYQTHFHEVAHLLINYKLKKLGLYTLPFLMEGFAVAVGGRGGMAPRVLTDLGYYLEKSGILTYYSILTNEGFYNNDASMSYAVAGLYNSFLLSELGGEKYLELYKKVNGDLEFVKGLYSSQINLPEIAKFDYYLNKYNDDKLMYVDEKDTISTELDIKASNGNCVISGDYVKFFTKEKYSIGFGELLTFEKYYSRKFSELYQTDKVCYFKYFILTNENEISIYNLWNDEMIYSYSYGLSVVPINIPSIKGYYTFFIQSSLFGKDFLVK